MNTIELTIYVGEDWQELLIADLSDLDFDAFLQDDLSLKAYIPAPRWDDSKREEIQGWLLQRGLSARLEERVIQKQNWNRQWEETIQPIAVGPFLVKPTWATIPPEHAGRILLEIDPKMSFGTGYHESTRLVLRFLPDLIRGGERVLDAGTGTGILAIAALKLGAICALAFDNDEWAQVNAVENILLNDVADMAKFLPGSIEMVPEDRFDLILANINRSTLWHLMPEFARRAIRGAKLVISGLLTVSDRDPMLTLASSLGYKHSREATEGEWWAAVFVFDPEK